MSAITTAMASEEENEEIRVLSDSEEEYEIRVSSDSEEEYEIPSKPFRLIDQKLKRVRQYRRKQVRARGDSDCEDREADLLNDDRETREMGKSEKSLSEADSLLRTVGWSTKAKNVFHIPQNDSGSEIECEIHHLVLTKEEETKQELLNEYDDRHRVIKNATDDDLYEIECDIVLDEAEGNSHGADLVPRTLLSSTRDIERRQLKCEGKAYVKRNGKVVPEKRFVEISSCCLHHCYKKVNRECQSRLFSSFYAPYKTKQEQDSYVASMLLRAPPKTSEEPDNVRRPKRWTYEVPIDGTRIPICQVFLLRVFQLSQKRIRVIQKRLSKNECTFEERRGKHANRPHKLPHDAIELFHAHLQEIPPEGRPSPSTNKLSKNLRFTKKKLFELFRDYYSDKTGKALPMKYNTYVQICNRLRH